MPYKSSPAEVNKMRMLKPLTDIVLSINSNIVHQINERLIYKQFEFIARVIDYKTNTTEGPDGKSYEKYEIVPQVVRKLSMYDFLEKYRTVYAVEFAFMYHEILLENGLIYSAYIYVSGKDKIQFKLKENLRK